MNGIVEHSEKDITGYVVPQIRSYVPTLDVTMHAWRLHKADRIELRRGSRIRSAVGRVVDDNITVWHVKDTFMPILVEHREIIRINVGITSVNNHKLKRANIAIGARPQAARKRTSDPLSR